MTFCKGYELNKRLFQTKIMNAIIFITLISVFCKFYVTSLSLSLPIISDQHWNLFKLLFGKKYSPEEESMRRSIYEKTHHIISTHNNEFDNGRKSYNLGANQFSDMSDEEFISTSTGLDPKVNCKKNSELYSPPHDISIPHSLDWNKKGYVTPVQNQGSCNACWAFGGAGALEGQHKKVMGKLVKLSEQQFIDCSKRTGNYMCQGGQMCRAYESAITKGGVTMYKYYPYKEKAGQCKFSKKYIGSKLSGYTKIPYGDENALLKAVATVGPVAAGLDGSRPHFRYYKSGIYDDPGCSNTSESHAVLITGYGTLNGKDYWLIKNSWGTSWGENGFGKIARNKNNLCGIANNALFPVLKKK